MDRPSPRPQTTAGPCVAAVMAAVVLTGCAGSAVTAPNPIEIDRVEYTRMYNAAVEVLREHGFWLDRRSHRFGTITTRDLDSPTLLEPWKAINTTDQQALESTLNHVRRRAVVTIEPALTPAHPSEPPQPDTEPSTYRMRVEVFAERSQHPNRRLTGSTTGHNIYGVLNNTPAEYRRRGITANYWQPLGRDTYLEQRILAQIVRRSLVVTP